MALATHVGTTEEFETIYADAHGNAALVPWARGRAHPALVAWLNAVAPSLVRCGARVAVVGCGLGDDARELNRRGYDVTAFDCSPSAIAWAKDVDHAHAGIFHIADLFEFPSRWRHRFDLVVEVNTIQALPPESRADALRAMGELMSPRGYLLVVCRGASAPVPIDAGPPWPLTVPELEGATGEAGLRPVDSVSSFDDEEGIARLRGLFVRAR